MNRNKYKKKLVFVKIIWRDIKKKNKNLLVKINIFLIRGRKKLNIKVLIFKKQEIELKGFQIYIHQNHNKTKRLFSKKYILSLLKSG